MCLNISAIFFQPYFFFIRNNVLSLPMFKKPAFKNTYSGWNCQVSQIVSDTW